jgi:hypothetical protein
MPSILKEQFLVKKYEGKTWSEVAEAPVYAIAGVSEKDGEDLYKAFNIKTIQDLANNQYIWVAQGICSFSRVTMEILDKKFKQEEFEQLRKLPVHAIKGVSENDAVLLKRAFGIDTIEDLAENKFIHIAQSIDTLALLEKLSVEEELH